LGVDPAGIVRQVNTIIRENTGIAGKLKLNRSWRSTITAKITCSNKKRIL
jgi:hypothetical protein